MQYIIYLFIVFHECNSNLLCSQRTNNYSWCCQGFAFDISKATCQKWISPFVLQKRQLQQVTNHQFVYGHLLFEQQVCWAFFPEHWSLQEHSWWWTLPNWATRRYRNCCLRLIFPFLHTLWHCKMMTARVLTVSGYLCPLFALVMQDDDSKSAHSEWLSLSFVCSDAARWDGKSAHCEWLSLSLVCSDAAMWDGKSAHSEWLSLPLVCSGDARWDGKSAHSEWLCLLLVCSGDGRWDSKSAHRVSE